MDGAIGILRGIFFAIDSVVYGIVGKIYNIFIMITEATFLTPQIIKDFSNRVYILISLIMAFRLAFSFVNYVVNPEQLSDKQKGGGKLIINIILTVGLLASVPLLFNELYYVQGVIIRERIVEKIVLGSESGFMEKNTDVGDGLAAGVFFGFFRPNPYLNGCQEGYLSDSCIESVDKAGKNSLKENDLGKLYKNAYKNNSLTTIHNSHLVSVKATDMAEDFSVSEIWGFDYWFGISTIGGIALCWILIGFCLDAAVRTVKLAILQLIAPIPIILNLVPGSKNNYLGNWGKEVGSTWVSLFIRILIIAFSMYFINLITAEDGGIFSFISGGSASNILVSVVITFGVLLFAKEFPKLLENLLGIKSSGSLTLNPLKRIKENALTAGVLGGVTGGVVGAVATAAHKFGASRSEGKGFIRSAFSGAAGLVTGGVTGASKGAFTADGRKNGIKAGTSVANDAAERIHRYGSTTMRERRDARIRQAFGMKSEADIVKGAIEDVSAFSSQIDTIFKRANSEMIKHNFTFTDSNKTVINMDHFKAEKERLTILRNMDTSTMNNAQRAAHAHDISDLQTYVSKTEKLAEQAYVDEVLHKKINDTEMKTHLGRLRDLRSSSSDTDIKNHTIISSGEDIKGAKTLADNRKVALESSSVYHRMQEVASAINKTNKK